MPEKIEYDIADKQFTYLLNLAIQKWNPALPRRWLHQYGYLYEQGCRSPMYEKYCLLRSLALNKTKGSSECYAQNWPVEGLRLAL
ncbi:hypothetical protein D3C85_1051470 [compost metagenome]